MLERGITRLAVQSLFGSSEKEREYAVKLLLEFCSHEECCIRIASEKGALVLLSSMAGNLEFPSLSSLAEEVLRQIERVEDNVQCLAAAGRFEPLISRLRDGMYHSSFCFFQMEYMLMIISYIELKISVEGLTTFIFFLWDKYRAPK